MKNDRYQRKQYLIDKPFQYKYLTQWFIFAILFMMTTAGVVIVVLTIFKSATALELKEIVFMAHIDIILVALAAIFFGVYLIRLSHRVAGAAYRLEQSLQRIIKGDYDFTVTLREKDHLKHLADDMNELIVKLRKNDEVIKRLSSEVKYLLFVLSEYESIPQNIKDLMSKMDETIKELFPDKPTPTTETRIWVTANHKPPSPAPENGGAKAEPVQQQTAP